MLLECEKRVIALPTAPVIAYTYQRNTTLLDSHRDAAGSGGECILDQLLDH